MADLSMIVRMVIYKCRELENPVTETLAAYVAQTTMNGCKFNSPDFLASLLRHITDERETVFLKACKLTWFVVAQRLDVFTSRIKSRKRKQKTWST